MLLTKALKRALVSLLLLTVFAVLAQGVLHEIFHDADHQTCNSAAEVVFSSDHDEDCHSHHQSCSSLSCAQGALFLAESAFCWNTFGQIELLKWRDNTFLLPIISASFFKPPRATIS